MKKAYVKPEIMFENFSLSTSIAGSCESIVGNQSRGNCPIMGTGGIAIFDAGVENSACKFTPEGMGGDTDQWDGFCYHVPVETANFFNS